MHKFTLYYYCGTLPHEVWFDTFSQAVRYGLLSASINGFYLKCVRKHAS